MTAREEFRLGVFLRDGYKCVICKEPAVDAHHIMERRLFPDGGYELDNGASLCEKHHLEAESTMLSCNMLREVCRIARVVLPPHLYPDAQYTKWGDIINEDGSRTPGELFDDPSVQKIIQPCLKLYTPYRKYPRTYHLPWSPTISDDDRVLDSPSIFEGKFVIVTEKMDGENTTIYWDGYMHARSLTYAYHPSRERMKALAAQISYQLPFGWRVCGENLTARHSVPYEDLPSFFMLFSIWNEKNECLEWRETIEWALLLDLETVPVLYAGGWREDFIRNNLKRYSHMPIREGYVVRTRDSFHYKDFRDHVAKCVYTRPTSSHNWMMQEVHYNTLQKEASASG